jgi:flavin-dependent dehydrogenase
MQPVAVPAVPSGIRPAEASSSSWDVVVAGAGPAGAVTARQLAIRGASVLLVDRVSFPRWKVCGCCLNRATLAALRALGLDGVIAEAEAPRLDRMRLAMGGSEASLSVRGGLALSREMLDAALVREAIAAGAAFLPRTEAVLLAEPAGDRRAVRLRSEGEEWIATARLAVAADGLGGTFLRKFEAMQPRVVDGSPMGAGVVLEQAPGFYEAGTIYMACGRDAYVGAVRLEDGRLDLAAAVRCGSLRGPAALGELVRDTLRECRFPVPTALDRAAWRGTPRLTRIRPRFASERLFVVGDSAGYVEPFTGEGISWAIQAAGLLEPCVQQALRGRPAEAEAAWQRDYRTFLHRRRRVCRFASKLLRSGHAARVGIWLLGRAPWLAAPWISEISTLDRKWKALAEGRS